MTKKKIHRKLTGIITSNKMDKTVVVKVDQIKIHPKYHKRYTVSKKYKAHDEKNEYTVGSKIVIMQCKPISKNKKWRVIKKLS